MLCCVVLVCGAVAYGIALFQALFLAQVIRSVSPDLFLLSESLRDAWAPVSLSTVGRSRRYPPNNN